MSDTERLLVGKQITWKDLEAGGWVLHVTGMTAFARLEGQEVVGAQQGMPYALLQCTLLRDKSVGGATEVTLPVSHREDFKAVAWLYASAVGTSDGPRFDMFVEYEPGGGFLGRVKPQLGVVIRTLGAADHYKGVIAGEVDVTTESMLAARERGENPTERIDYHPAGPFEVPGD